MILKNRIVLKKQKNKILFFYICEDKPVEIQVFSEQKESLGTIYLGRVLQNVQNINASFVDIGNEVKGFLAHTDCKQGDLLPVQLIKEKTKTKDAVVSTDLSLAGVYCVVHTKDTKLSLSSKLSTPEKKALTKQIGQAAADIPYGVIIRTNAVHASADELKKEIAFLSERLTHVLQYASMRTPFSVLYAAPEEWMRAVTDIRIDALDEIITDDMALYEALKAYLMETYGMSCFDSIKLNFYQDALLPLDKLYGLDSKLNLALHKKVWLKSGGFLVIEPTEALVAIDVNTGKNIKKGNREDTFFSTNLEAAREIAKQLRLRNLSGMILIDFINMSDVQNQKKLLDFMADELKKDPVKAQVLDMTQLGLVEVTRMKVRQPLYEQLAK